MPHVLFYGSLLRKDEREANGISAAVLGKMRVS